MRGQLVEANLGLDKQDENERLMNGSKQKYLVNGTPIMYTVHILWLFHDVSLQLLSKV